MTIRSSVEYKGIYPEIAVRQLNNAVKGANEGVLKQWHVHNLPLHFKGAASAQKYRYYNRSKGYLRRKLRKVKHTRPLEFSGRTKRLMRQMMRVSVTQKRGVARFPGVGGFIAANSRKQQPHLPAEPVRTTPAEERRLAESHEAFATEALNSIKETKRVQA